MKLLEADALLERRIDDNDRRRHSIAITSLGRAALKRAMTERREWLSGSMGRHLDEAERATLLAAADVMLDFITREAGGPFPEDVSSAAGAETE